MPDITMCDGGDCPRKQKCYRFTAVISEFRQAYFKNPPVQNDGSCAHFVSNAKRTIDEK